MRSSTPYQTWEWECVDDAGQLIVHFNPFVTLAATRRCITRSANVYRTLVSVCGEVGLAAREGSAFERVRRVYSEPTKVSSNTIVQ